MMAQGLGILRMSRMSCADLIRPSIALHEIHSAKRMDCRVKPGNDDEQADTPQT
jgi:hypothetical protein